MLSSSGAAASVWPRIQRRVMAAHGEVGVDALAPQRVHQRRVAADVELEDQREADQHRLRGAHRRHQRRLPATRCRARGRRNRTAAGWRRGSRGRDCPSTGSRSARWLERPGRVWRRRPRLISTGRMTCSPDARTQCFKWNASRGFAPNASFDARLRIRLQVRQPATPARRTRICRSVPHRLHGGVQRLGLGGQHFLLALHRNFREFGERVLVEMLEPPPRHRIDDDMRIKMQEVAEVRCGLRRCGAEVS